jgi:hypothetical protein
MATPRSHKHGHAQKGKNQPGNLMRAMNALRYMNQDAHNDEANHSDTEPEPKKRLPSQDAFKQARANKKAVLSVLSRKAMRKAKRHPSKAPAHSSQRTKVSVWMEALMLVVIYSFHRPLKFAS